MQAGAFVSARHAGALCGTVSAVKRLRRIIISGLITGTVAGYAYRVYRNAKRSPLPASGKEPAA